MILHTEMVTNFSEYLVQKEKQKRAYLVASTQFRLKQRKLSCDLDQLNVIWNKNELFCLYYILKIVFFFNTVNWKVRA